MLKSVTILLVLFLVGDFAQAQSIQLVNPYKGIPRIAFSVANLEEAIRSTGVKTTSKANKQIVLVIDTAVESKEGYLIQASISKISIKGHDASGLMYGIQSLTQTINAKHKIPSTYKESDKPSMVLRGTCIGLQKPYYLPGRTVYEYPYTEETFPWFYDKKLWIKVLDSLYSNRMNALFLWNGHPFASLVKLKEYPYAVEVDDSTFKKNEEIYSFLTTEADKRGIWVIQMFYNIIVSKPFAEHHGIKTQDRNRPIIPLISDYTRKSIAAFVEKYPNVGLMVALGEAMEGVGQDDIDWFTQTIIPGVKDGLQRIGKKEEPPIVLRSHDTDAPSVMAAALPLYKNLYTESKYNGESLTTYTPRGPWAELHRTLARSGSIQLENVHILANLEPFRWASPSFIFKSIEAMKAVHLGNGLHLYPQASYWDWPYTADKTEKRLLQIERDWLWYKLWGRYAWSTNRVMFHEVAGYQSELIGSYFGLSRADGERILSAYDESGEISPKILRRFGITDGNRQTMTLGMMMPQLINPFRFSVALLLYNSEGPEGEMLIEYAEREAKGLPHVGETPIQVMKEIVEHAEAAVQSIEDIKGKVSKNQDEFKRLKNDMYIYRQLAYYYAYKADAALKTLKYKYSLDIKDLEAAYTSLDKSVHHFDSLTQLTKDTYLYANSMQTQQRRIPVGGDNGMNKHWVELLPQYKDELLTFRSKIDSIKAPKSSTVLNVQIAKPVAVEWKMPIAGFFTYEVGRNVFSDSNVYVKNFDPALKALEGIRLSSREMMKGSMIRFVCKDSVELLIGYFNSPDKKFLPKPQLEIDASANDYGQAEPRLRNALIINGGMPPVSIHAYRFAPGEHTLRMEKGLYLVVGVSSTGSTPKKDAGLTNVGVYRELDWLFER